MADIKINVDDKDYVFTPIKVTIELTIKSRDELKDLQNEFTDGAYQHTDIITNYSKALYDLLTEFRSAILNI